MGKPLFKWKDTWNYTWTVPLIRFHYLSIYLAVFPLACPESFWFDLKLKLLFLEKRWVKKIKKYKNKCWKEQNIEMKGNRNNIDKMFSYVMYITCTCVLVYHEIVLYRVLKFKPNNIFFIKLSNIYLSKYLLNDFT